MTNVGNSFTKALVIRGGALGDFILTLPVLQALRQAQPKAELEVLGNPRIASLALAGGLADRATSVESRGLEGFFTPDSDLPKEWAEYFDAFDLIVSFLFDPDAVFQKNLSSVSGGRFLQGCHRPADGIGRHATEQLLDPLQSLGLEPADADPKLVPPHPAHADPALIAVHPGSGSERKNWPISHWEEFLNRILRSDTRIRLLLVGGEADVPRVERLIVTLPEHRFQVCFDRPLTEVAERFGACAFYLGHDSGVSHLAAAVGCSGLVLWGGTDEATWQPRGGRMNIIRSGGDLATLSVDDVFAAYKTHSLSRP